MSYKIKSPVVADGHHLLGNVNLQAGALDGNLIRLHETSHSFFEKSLKDSRGTKTWNFNGLKRITD